MYYITFYMLSFIFMASGLSKIEDLQEFTIILNHNYGFSIETSALIALVLPYWEISTGILLLISLTRSWGAFNAFTLSVMFLYSETRLAPFTQCGCFGAEASPFDGWRMLSDSLLCVCAGIVWRKFVSDDLARARCLRTTNQIA